MGVRIITAEPDSDVRRAVYRFRYEVYVEEMRRPQRYADHAARTIAEPLDACSTVLAALDDAGAVVGTIRYTATADCPDSEYTAIYRMDHFAEFFPARCSFTTKLMVAPAHRRTTLGARLSLSAWEYAASQRHALNFIDCNEHLVDYFKGLGYLPFPERFDHDEYGRVQVMTIPILDLAYLSRIGSPILRRATALSVEHEDQYFAVTTYLATLSAERELPCPAN